MAPKKEVQTFESALERIEQIAARMETGEFPLDQLIQAYEEGLGLIRYCSERLDEAEKRLETITRNASGQPKGLATVQKDPEIPPSTPAEGSGSEEDSSSAGDSAARLF
jgi:exodeoxyribonuclease VII small subunit